METILLIILIVIVVIIFFIVGLLQAIFALIAENLGVIIILIGLAILFAIIYGIYTFLRKLVIYVASNLLPNLLQKTAPLLDDYSNFIETCLPFLRPNAKKYIVRIYGFYLFTWFIILLYTFSGDLNIPSDARLNAVSFIQATCFTTAPLILMIGIYWQLYVSILDLNNFSSIPKQLPNRLKVATFLSVVCLSGLFLSNLHELFYLKSFSYSIDTLFYNYLSVLQASFIFILQTYFAPFCSIYALIRLLYHYADSPQTFTVLSALKPFFELTVNIAPEFFQDIYTYILPFYLTVVSFFETIFPFEPE